jgi:hypothetical protein
MFSLKLLGFNLWDGSGAPFFAGPENRNGNLKPAVWLQSGANFLVSQLSKLISTWV